MKFFVMKYFVFHISFIFPGHITVLSFWLLIRLPLLKIEPVGSSKIW